MDLNSSSDRPGPLRRNARAFLLRGVALPWLAAALALPAAAQPEIDPFYSGLRTQGASAFTTGDFARAARDLRIACFGMLEHPTLLTDCMGRLGAAQARQGDREAFGETVRRLVELHERFDALSDLDLPVPVREELESGLVRWVAEEQLAAIPAFEHLASHRAAAKIARLPRAERRGELERLVSEQPDEPKWRLLLADLEMDAGDTAAVLTHTTAALSADPENLHARCLRGQARSQTRSWQAAVDDLEQCSLTASRLPLSRALLESQVELGRFDEAAAFLGALPPELRDDRSLNRLRRQVERGQAAAQRQALEAQQPAPLPPATDTETASAIASDTPSIDASETADGDEGEDAAPPAAAPDLSLSEADQAKAKEIRDQVALARHAGQLSEPLSQAVQLADANPGNREAQFLAARIAYRASLWEQAIEFFERGGDPGDDEPVLLFYLAVSHFEAGQAARASEVLRRCLSSLERNAFVDQYVEKILGGAEKP